MHEVIAAAWDSVASDWENQTRHDALLQLTVQHSAYHWVCGKYRERKGDAIADAQLAKLANAAMVIMLASSAAKRGTSASSPYRRALIWMVVFGLFVVLGLLAAKVMVVAHPAPRP